MVQDIFSKPLAGIDPGLIFWQAVIASALALLLGMIIAYTYRHTHRGSSYSQNFGQVLIIMAMVVALIMIIIGSNIARAFSLVGALSIIRYRTAVKDARDTMFVFFALMVGMSCGVGLRAIAVYATILICSVIYFLGRINFGALMGQYSLLKVILPVDQKFEEVISPVLDEWASELSVLSAQTVKQGTAVEVTYRLIMKDMGRVSELIDELRKRNGNDRILFYPGGQAVEET